MANTIVFNICKSRGHRTSYFFGSVSFSCKHFSVHCSWIDNRPRVSTNFSGVLFWYISLNISSFIITSVIIDPKKRRVLPKNPYFVPLSRLGSISRRSGGYRCFAPKRIRSDSARSRSSQQTPGDCPIPSPTGNRSTGHASSRFWSHEYHHPSHRLFPEKSPTSFQFLRCFCQSISELFVLPGVSESHATEWCPARWN